MKPIITKRPKKLLIRFPKSTISFNEIVKTLKEDEMEWEIFPDESIPTKFFLYVFKKIRSTKHKILTCVVVSDLKVESYINLIIWMIRFFGGRRAYIIDDNKNIIKVTNNPLKIIFELFRLWLELVLSLTLYIRSQILLIYLQKSRLKGKFEENKLKNFFYLKTDLINNLTAGGSIGHVVGVINAFYKRKINPYYVSFTNFPQILPEIDRCILKPNYFYKNTPELPNLQVNNLFIKKLKILSKNIKVDFIYQRYCLFNIVGVRLSKKLQIPLILEYNGSEIWISQNWGRKLFFEKTAKKIEEINLQQASFIVVISNVLQDELVDRGINKDKIICYPNCVDPEIYDPLKYIPQKADLKKKLGVKENEKIITFVGSFSKWHGIEILVNTIPDLCHELPKAKFLLIGDGPLFKMLFNSIKDHNLFDRVILTGIIPQQETPNYLSISDIFVSPHIKNPDGSKFFGSPTKLFEYMAMGKGIVASNLEQIGEILTHGKDALLFEPGNCVEFKNRVSELYHNDLLIDKLGKKSRQLVLENYTWDHHILKIIERINKPL